MWLFSFLLQPLLIKTDSTEDSVLGVTTPLSSGACSASGSAVSFTVGGEMGGDMMGEGRLVQGEGGLR